MDARGRWSRINIFRTVEDCLALRISALLRAGLLVPGRSASGQLTSGNTVDGILAPVAELFIKPVKGAGLALQLHYQVEFEGIACPVDQEIILVTTRQRLGGLRWWFHCLLVGPSGPCRSRAGVLYLPPGEQFFGCRHCHTLTYTSRQQSRHRRVGDLLAAGLYESFNLPESDGLL